MIYTLAINSVCELSFESSSNFKLEAENKPWRQYFVGKMLLLICQLIRFLPTLRSGGRAPPLWWVLLQFSALMLSITSIVVDCRP